jgi:septum formation protein
MRVILASKSPRRREILECLGVKFEIITVETDEHSDCTEPSQYVKDIAFQKGKAVAKAVGDNSALIISADTVVVLDNEILGKPKSRDNACEILGKLQGRDHVVLTAVSLTLGGENLTDYAETVVRFGAMTESEIKAYVDTLEPMDKAGAYAVQGIASQYIDGIDGCYFNVVGFPTRLFAKMLKSFDLGIENLK